MNGPGLCAMEIDDFGPLCGLQWMGLWPSDAMPDIQRSLDSARSGKSYTFQAFCPTAKGTPRWWDVTVSPVRDSANGAIVRILSVSRDCTARKKLEDDLRQLAADLSDADRRKNEFLATLAHELRNPLAPIRNGLQLLRLSPNDSVNIELATQMMERQLAQVVRLVDDLMDVSRISQGKLQLVTKRLDVATVVVNAVEASQTYLENMGHELTVDVPSEPVWVDADLIRLAQVLINLLNNAAKYSDRGSQIWLTVKSEGTDAIVSVRDSGIGIASEQLPHIFDLFSQVDSSLDRSQGGLGIGLSLVSRLVQMHGGTIQAKSDGMGLGSEFIVRLPLAVDLSKSLIQQQITEPNNSAPSLRVLIVDDNRDGADSLAMMLKFSGHEIRTAYDGQQGIEIAEQFQPNVILLDIGLPKLNGYEACLHIRKQAWSKSTTLIAVTGRGHDDNVKRSIESGFDRHMVKPVDPQDLAKLLASAELTAKCLATSK